MEARKRRFRRFVEKEVAMAETLIVLLAAGLIFLGCGIEFGEEPEMLPGLTPPDIETVEQRRRDLLDWAVAQRPLPDAPASPAAVRQSWRVTIGQALMRVGAWIQGEVRRSPVAPGQAFSPK